MYGNLKHYNNQFRGIKKVKRPYGPFYYINKNCMKSLFNFIIESAPKTDNTIYYKIGLNKFNWLKGSAKERATRKYNISGDHFRQGVISYAKDVMVPILPDNEEIIHRDKRDLPGLIGETEKQLMHPDYWTMTEYILSKHKKKHDILTLFECSNAKPYSSNRTIRKLFLDKYGVFTDFASISNPGIIPMEYSHFYPYRYDEWDHFAEKPDIAEKYVKINASRFLHYVKTLGYKHVFVIMQHPAPQKALKWLHDNDIEGCSKWLTLVIDGQFRDKIEAKLKSKFGSDSGLYITRMINAPDVREHYENLLKKELNEEDKEKLEELQKICKEYKGQTKREKLNEFNEKNGYMGIDNTKGTKDSFKRLTEDDTDSSMVSKYYKFVQSFNDKLEDRIKSVGESKEYHKNRIYFTVLDLLLDYHKDTDIIDDPDTRYWSMKAAIDKLKNPDLVNICEYMYYYKSSLKELGIKEEDIIKSSDKLGVTQTKDDRK